MGGGWKGFWKAYDWLARANFANTLFGGVFDWRGWLLTAGGSILTFLWSAIREWDPLAVWLATVGVGAGIAVIYVAFRLMKNDIGKPKTQGPLENHTPLEISFDPANPSRRFWSRESPRDESGNKKPGVFWEYRVEIRNNSRNTVRNVSVTVEHIGQNLPVRPVDAIFDKIRKTSCDLKPGTNELVPIIRWPIPIVQAGMLAGATALEYGPVKVTASGDDIPPTTRIFQFDYQSEPMLFDTLSPRTITLFEAATRAYEALQHHDSVIAMDAFADSPEQKLVNVCEMLCRPRKTPEPLIKLYGNEPPSRIRNEIYMAPLNKYEFVVEDNSIALIGHKGATRYENLVAHADQVEAAILEIKRRHEP